MTPIVCVQNFYNLANNDDKFIDALALQNSVRSLFPALVICLLAHNSSVIHAVPTRQTTCSSPSL